MFNSGNPYQGDFKKVLCVCSAGLLRSPTAAMVLSQPPYNFNTRAVGVDVGHALTPIDEVMVNWADEIVCMEKTHMMSILGMFPDYNDPITVLDIPDRYAYRDPGLIVMIEERYEESLDDNGE